MSSTSTVARPCAGGDTRKYGAAATIPAGTATSRPNARRPRSTGAACRDGETHACWRVGEPEADAGCREAIRREAAARLCRERRRQHVQRRHDRDRRDDVDHGARAGFRDGLGTALLQRGAERLAPFIPERPGDARNAERAAGGLEEGERLRGEVGRAARAAGLGTHRLALRIEVRASSVVPTSVTGTSAPG